MKGNEISNGQDVLGIKDTMRSMIVKRGMPGMAVLSGTSESRIAKNDFSYTFDGDPATIYAQRINLDSTRPFSTLTTVIDSGEYKGRFAFIIEPLIAPKDAFRLLDLPPELRNMIFEFALQSSCIIHLEYSNRSYRFMIPFANPDIALLSVCKQIHHEASAIFFSINAFSFNSTAAASAFFQKIGINIQYVHHIGVQRQWFINTGTELMGQLVQAHRLKSLLIFGLADCDKIVRSMLPWIQTHAQVQACQDRARSDAQNGVQYDAQDNTHDDNQLDDDYHDEDSDQDHNQDHGQAQSQARSQTLFPRWHRHYPLETFLRLKEILSLREWDPNLYLMAPSDFTSISVNEARNADLLGRLKARYFRSLIGASPTTSLITTRTLRTPSGRGIGDGEAGMC